ncbi:MAG TPA: group 1 truncated hemoglobin [Magnetospirillaceae bacterium]|nr:group 1 truncated hemoglobin [Magnetospirillaceae bacterium]
MRRMLLTGVLLLLPLAGRAETTLFEDLGGREKISAFTTDLVDRITKDPRIGHFFHEADMGRLHDRLTDMFCHLTGEKRRFRGANMHNAHEGFGITDADFNTLVEDLEKAMDDYDVPWGTQTRFLAVLAPLKRDIVESK